MAGPHQIWKLDLEKQEVSTFAGSGREARKDGPLLEAGFAQPSGLATDGKNLYVADSESNIIRAIDLSGGKVETLVGGDLFEFGDEDGTGDDVRLQHPLGVFVLADKVLITDTYNHKIKELDPRTRRVKNLLGTGKPGQAGGTLPSFYEPGGLSVANGRLYVADTNNHAIRVVDLKTRETSTLPTKGLQPPALSDAANSTDEAAPNSEEIVLAPQRLRPGSEGAIVINVDLPAGYHLNPAAPQRYRVSVESGPKQLALSDSETGAARDKVLSRSMKNLQLPLRIPLRTLEPGKSELRAQLTLFYCREDNTGTCLVKTLVWRLPVEVTSAMTSSNNIQIQGKISAE